MTSKKDRKIFFFDIDGTLAYQGHVPLSTQHALTLLRQQGHLIFICTGRPYLYAWHHFSHLADGFITCNGRCIVYHDQILADFPLSSFQIQSFIEVMRKYHCGFQFVFFHDIYVEGEIDEIKNIMGKELTFHYHDRFSLKDIQAYMFDIFYQHHEDFLKVRSVLKDEVIFNEHTPHLSADATIIGMDKGLAIDHILHAFDIAYDHAYAFGDGMNDICMFSHVGHGIAMGNACDEVKAHAHYITKTIFQDGVASALKHYHLIDEMI